MIASLFWLTEFLLESSGAFLAYRKRLRILSALLAWRALADILTFVIAWRWGGNAYGVALWICLAVQYAILYALGMQIASKMVAEYKPITQYVYTVLAVVGSLAGWVFAMTDVWAQKFAGADAITSLMLLAVVLLGWIGRKTKLEGTWRIITSGLMISSFGNALCAVLASRWTSAWALYPIPAIFALLAWNLAAWKARIPQESAELRLNLRVRVPDRDLWLDESARMVQ